MHEPPDPYRSRRAVPTAAWRVGTVFSVLAVPVEPWNGSGFWWGALAALAAYALLERLARVRRSDAVDIRGGARADARRGAEADGGPRDDAALVTEAERAREIRHGISDLQAVMATAAERCNEAIVVTDLEGCIVFANEAACRLDEGLGHPIGTGNSRALLFDPRRVDPEPVFEMLGEVLDAGCAQVRVAVRPLPPLLPVVGAGAPRPPEPRWLDVAASPYVNECGEVAGVILVQRDVTAEVEREASRRLATEGAEARARIVEILARSGSFDDRLRDALATVCAMAGLQVQQKAGVFVVGDDGEHLRLRSHFGAFSERFLADERTVPFGRCLCGRVAESHEILVSDHCLEDVRHEHRWEGAPVHGHYIVPMMVQGDLVGVMFLYTDPYPTVDPARLHELQQIGDLLGGALVRERIRGELAAVSQRLELATTGAGLGVWEYDVVRGRLVWDERMEELFGLAAGSADYGSWRARFVEEDQDAFDQLMALQQSAINQASDVVLRVRSTMLDGDLRCVRFVATLHREAFRPDEDGVANYRIVGMCEDVTAQVVREQALADARDAAEAANRAKSEFLANMSHEIRTPMTAILGFAELIDTGEVEDLGQATRTVRTHAEHLLEIINDILDVSKIEAGKMDVERIPMAPHESVAEVLSLLRPRAEGKGVRLEATFATNLPRTIDSDPTRIRQILLNLVGNAIKFTETGFVRVAVEFCELDEDARGSLRIAVVDSGLGMSPDQLARVRCFESFTQADGSMTRRFGGTGLGLRISASLARLLGGRLEVSSEAGVGSTFTVTLDAGTSWRDAERIGRTAAFEQAEKEVAERLRAEKVLEGARVLVVDDGPDNRRLVSFFLRKAGADVDVAENGRVAVDLADQAVTDERPYDAILMDMQMPVLDGYSATRELRAGSGKDVPIFALTAHAMDGDAERCLEAGCDDYLTKPIDRAELLRRIRASIAGAAEPDLDRDGSAAVS